MAMVVCLVGGRELWLWAQRPADEQTLAQAYGDASLFYGAPRSDSTGKHITFIKTADVGIGVFLCDTATGRKRNVRVPGPDIDEEYPNLQVWPWSPDDSSFAYSGNKGVVICNGQTGQSTATVDLTTGMAGLTWLDPATIICLDPKSRLYQLNRLTDGTWTAKTVGIGAFALRSIKDETSVASSETATGEKADNAVDGDPTTSWFSGETAGPVWLQYQFSGLAWAITRYSLTSAATDAGADPREWQLLGSNDGANWTVLDTRSNVTFKARGQTKTYDFTNVIPYWFYRLKMTATAGGAGSGGRLAEFQLYSRDAPTTASSSSEVPPGESAWAAFDGYVHTKWFSNFMPPPWWLQYQICGGAGAALSKYTLTSADNAPEQDPRDWEFQASNDGVTWTTLDTRSGESFDSRLQTKSYSFNNVTPYCFYRLYITANHRMPKDGVQVAELDLGLRGLLAKIGNPDGGLALRNINAIVLASSAHNLHGGGANNVHDQDVATSWYSGRTKGPVWLQYEFNDVAWAMTQYKLVNSGTDSATDPRDWQLLASNDGITWTVLDRQSNQVFTSRRQAKRYPLQNETPYRFYRLNVTANAGGKDDGVRLAEFQLWSDDTPAVASANAENAPREGAAQAFDGDTNTKWFNANGGATGWLQYQFGGGQARVVSRYALTSGNDVPERDPKDWQFQASNDGHDWTTLDVEQNQSFVSRNQTKSYSFANDTDYRFYRLNITANHGVGALQLAELNLDTILPAGPAPAPNAGVAGGGQNRGMVSQLNPFANAFGLTTLDARTIAWGQSRWIWSMNLDAATPQPILDVQSALPANTTLQNFSYSKQTGRFLLSCDTAGTPSLWRLDPNTPSGLVKIADGLSDGKWTSGGGWVARQNNYLMVAHDLTSEPVRIVPRASIDGFAVSPNGQRLFIQGTIKDEVSSGVWQYDLASSKLTCLVPYSDKQLAGAKRENYNSASLRLPSGETLTYNVFPPVNGYRYIHHRYPLVIGDTTLWVVMRGAHGRLWIPALATGDAYVVVVNRADWWNGIEKWSDNVQAVYNEVVKTLPIDRNRVFLFGASAETTHMKDLATKSPGLWRGVILLNPTGLPDFSNISLLGQRPRILISAGGLEGEDQRFKQYQEKSLQSGVVVEYVIAPDEGHHFVGNAAQLQRTRDIMRLVFDE